MHCACGREIGPGSYCPECDASGSSLIARKCPICNTTFSPNAHFCTTCGARIQSSAVSAGPRFSDDVSGEGTINSSRNAELGLKQASSTPPKELLSETACRLWQKAAADRDSCAMYKLANIYMTGQRSFAGSAAGPTMVRESCSSRRYRRHD